MNTLPTVNPAEISSGLQVVAKHYAELLRGAFGPKLVSVVLFGSVARGDAKRDSDIDLLIVAEDLPQGRFARLRLLEGVDREFQDELDRLRSGGLHPRLARLLRTPDETAKITPVYLDFVEDAQLLYDREGFFLSVLARLRASLKRLGAERRISGRTRYWLLKPDLAPGEVIEL